MRSQCLLVAFLFGSAFATPIPTGRTAPLIGAIMPSDLPAGVPVYGFGQADSVERPAPSTTVSANVLAATKSSTTSTLAPVATPSDTTNLAASNPALQSGARFVAIGVQSVSSSTSTSSSVNAALQTGARFVGFGNAQTTPSTSSSAAAKVTAGMGSAQFRQKGGAIGN